MKRTIKKGIKAVVNALGYDIRRNIVPPPPCTPLNENDKIFSRIDELNKRVDDQNHWLCELNKDFGFPEIHENYARPNYGYCLWHGARLGLRLGYQRISVIEFGVAGGNGLLALESDAERIGKEFNIKIDVYGFDTGQGLPTVTDYRDMPYRFQEGMFAMDFEKLSTKIKYAKLVIGDVKDTVKTFIEKYNPAPIAAVMNDMDLYSSTVESFKLFENESKFFLPRIFTYFDDITGWVGDEYYNDYTGERLALAEFNNKHKMMKFSPQYHLLAQFRKVPWYMQIYVLHLFDHPEYNSFVSIKNRQLPLEG
jgi:hypothetical protein